MYVRIKRLPNLAELPLPQYANEGDSGRDLRAAIEGDEIVVAHGDAVKVPCGIALGLPFGMEAQIRPRSGLSSKKILVQLGTVDRPYIGELCVVLHNLSGKDFIIKRGDRVAQMVIAPVSHWEWEETDELNETSRGAKGFGSSGIK